MCKDELIFFDAIIIYDIIIVSIICDPLAARILLQIHNNTESIDGSTKFYNDSSISNCGALHGSIEYKIEFVLYGTIPALPSSVDAKLTEQKEKQQYDNYKCGKKSFFHGWSSLSKNKNKNQEYHK